MQRIGGEVERIRGKEETSQSQMVFISNSEVFAPDLEARRYQILVWKKNYMRSLLETEKLGLNTINSKSEILL